MTTIRGVLILIFICISAGCVVYLHFLPTGLNPIRNTVSEYGATRYKIWYQVMCVTQAVAAFLTATALYLSIKPIPVLTIVMLITLGLARLVISQAPVIVEHGDQKTVSRIHMLMAGIIFGSAATAAMSFNGVVAANTDWASLHFLLRLVARLITLFAILTFVAIGLPRGKRYVGLTERLLYIAIVSWFVVIALHLI